MVEHDGGAHLKRGMGVIDATAMLVGGIIGAGIFISVGAMAGLAGPALALAFLVASLPYVFENLCNIQLGNVLPVAGSDWVAGTRGATPFWGSLVAPTAIFAGFMGLGLLGYGFGALLQPFFPQVPVQVWSVGIILLVGIINYLGVNITAKIQLILVIVFLLIPLLIFIFGGWSHMQPELQTPLIPNGFVAFMIAAAIAAFSMVGFKFATGWGAEIKNPRRNIPITLICTFIIVLFLYMGVSWVLTGILPWQEAAESVLAVPDAAKTFLGDAGFIIMIIGGEAAIVTSILGVMMVATRYMTAMGRDLYLPVWFASIHPKFKTPHLSIIFWIVTAAIFSMIGFGIGQYAVLVVVNLMAVDIIMSIGLFRVINKMPELNAKAQVKFSLFWRWVAMIGMIVMASTMIVFGLMQNSLNPWLFFGWILIGVIYYFIRRAYLKNRGINMEQKMSEMPEEALKEIESA